MRFIKRFLRWSLGIICGLYLLLQGALHIPAVQRWAGGAVSSALRDVWHWDISVGRIQLGIWNRIIIDDITLRDEQDSLIPVVAGPSGGGSNISDSDMQMIVKAIMDLKQEVDRLKRMVLSSTSETSAAPALTAPTAAAAPMSQMPGPAPAEEEPEWQEAAATEPLSIRQANLELIQHALEKHNGNVKDAAAELGISERTIYRKLAKLKNK